MADDNSYTDPSRHAADNNPDEALADEDLKQAQNDVSQTPLVPEKGPNDETIDEVTEPLDDPTNHDADADPDAYIPGEDQLRNVVPPDQRDDSENT